jgi:hypothetical protein
MPKQFKFIAGDFNLYMMKPLKSIFIAIVAVVLLNACSPAGGENTGSEYMADMAHSIAYESNVYTYYHYNTWDSASTFKRKAFSNPNLPVQGTIPRGYAGLYYATGPEAQKAMMEHLHGMNAINAISVPLNGNVPYYYADTNEDRVRATAEIIGNPFPITDEGLARAKVLYNTFCGICHGEKGDGLGYLVSDDNKNAKYPAQPANLLDSAFVNSSNGRYYHAIMYGLNTMGAYPDKLSFEERWQVIHYIRSLQAASKNLVYNEKTNTFNPQFGVPGSVVQAAAKQSSDAAEQPAEGATDTQEQQHGGGH